MCKAFSAIVKKNGDVLWKFGMDSHDDLIRHFKLNDNEDDRDRMKFARIEIYPQNGSYLNPDKWVFNLDESITPTWWKRSYQIFAEQEHKKWKKQLNKILINKEIVFPFSVKPPAKVLKKHIELLRQWDSVMDSVVASVGASVRASVGASVWDSMRASVMASVWASVWDRVWDSVWASVWDSVGASVWAYTGSFFNLPISAWRYTENIKTKKYPFQSLVDLWEMGIVPSFDGTTWRLHAGKDAGIIFEITKEKLAEIKPEVEGGA